MHAVLGGFTRATALPKGATKWPIRVAVPNCQHETQQSGNAATLRGDQFALRACESSLQFLERFRCCLTHILVAIPKGVCERPRGAGIADRPQRVYYCKPHLT